MEYLFVLLIVLALESAKKVAFERWQTDEKQTKLAHWELELPVTDERKHTQINKKKWMTTMENSQFTVYTTVIYGSSTHIINIHWAWASFILISISCSYWFDHVLLLLFICIINVLLFIIVQNLNMTSGHDLLLFGIHPIQDDHFLFKRWAYLLWIRKSLLLTLRIKQTKFNWTTKSRLCILFIGID